jgi:S1-C subfamily serine protease
MSATAPLLAEFSASLAGIVAAASPALVSVHAQQRSTSGFVWKPGLIVTADEALAEAGEVTLTLPGGARAAARLLGRDLSTDVALLATDAATGPAAALRPLTPPAGALALGLGARDGATTAAFGIVARSGPAWRSLRGGEIDARIELDIALRRASEGGLVLDAEGQAFGMAVFGPRRRTIVIPAATIARVAAQLEAHGRVTRGYLGLGLQPIRLDAGGGGGVLVLSVDANGPGAAAGLHQGDIVTEWEGERVETPRQLLRALGGDSVGRIVRLGLRRGGQAVEVSLTVGERPTA